MRGRNIKQGPDAGTWSGQVDLTRVVVIISMLAGISLLWLGVAIVIGIPM